MEKPLRRLWENEDGSPSEGSVSVLTRFRHRVVKWLVLSYLVTLAAQIGTTPLIAYYFFRTYPFGFIVGPFAVGLVSLIVAVGMASVCVGFIYLPLTAKLIALLQPCDYLYLLGTDRDIWAGVGYREANPADGGCLCPLHRLLFRDRVLAIYL